ncbi:MAG: hypothetical protein ACYS9X_30465 [Planctomycetota bacterium]
MVKGRLRKIAVFPVPRIPYGVGPVVVLVDTTASRFTGASIAGLVVGAMGCFIFGLHVRRWGAQSRH